MKLPAISLAGVVPALVRYRASRLSPLAQEFENDRVKAAYFSNGEINSAMDYQFKPLGKKCAATGEELTPGSVCYSALIEDDGELQRLDFSEKGWTGPPEKCVGTWVCTVPVPVQHKKNPLDPAALMTCFEQLMEAGNPLQEKLRYILGLLLVQKKRLHCDGSRQEGDETYLQLSGAQGEGAYEVRDLQLSDEEMQELQGELNAYLAAEWG